MKNIVDDNMNKIIEAQRRYIDACLDCDVLVDQLETCNYDPSLSEEMLRAADHAAVVLLLQIKVAVDKRREAWKDLNTTLNS